MKRFLIFILLLLVAVLIFGAKIAPESTGTYFSINSYDNNIKNKNEFYIFNLKGKLLKKIMLPFAEYDEVQFSPYTINDGKLYQLIENDNETWELHVIKISSQHS